MIRHQNLNDEVTSSVAMCYYPPGADEGTPQTLFTSASHITTATDVSVFLFLTPGQPPQILPIRATVFELQPLTPRLHEASTIIKRTLAAHLTASL
jgi:hypothetical protein